MMRLADGTAYEIEGSPARPAVVLIHGLGLCRKVWQWQKPALTPFFRVITFDLLGHGDSAAASTNPTLSLYSDQLAAILDACSVPSVGVVGFSLGGMVARRFAMDHPKRTSALALLNTAHRRSETAQHAIEQRVKQARIAGPAATVEEALERWFTDAFRRENPDVMALVRGWVLHNDPATYYLHYEVLAGGVSEITAPQTPIKAPTLVMTAEEDHGNSPEMAQAIARDIPGSQMSILAGLRHMALIEDPGSVNAVLCGFLRANLIGATR